MERHIDLPELAEMLSRFFPEMDGRVVASVGDDISKDTMPALPLVNLALARVSAESHDFKNGANARLDLIDEIDIEFWQAPLRLKRRDQSESPFWTYYPFHALLRRLAGYLAFAGAERGVFFEFRGAEIAATAITVIITFHFRQHYRLCPDYEAPEADKISACGADGTESWTAAPQIKPLSF